MKQVSRKMISFDKTEFFIVINWNWLAIKWDLRIYNENPNHSTWLVLFPEDNLGRLLAIRWRIINKSWACVKPNDWTNWAITLWVSDNYSYLALSQQIQVDIWIFNDRLMRYALHDIKLCFMAIHIFYFLRKILFCETLNKTLCLSTMSHIFDTF